LFVFQIVAMARVNSNVWYVGGAAGGGSGSEGHYSGASERMESAQLSNAGSHGEADDVTDEGSRPRRCFFGPSIVTVS
jgi:hypothetical protein